MLSRKIRSLKKDLAVVYLALKDKRTALYVRLLAMLILAYALSPIDLIPDFIPVLGLLDDLILLPVGIYLIYRLLPPDIKKDCEVKARNLILKKRFNIISVMILIIWIGCISLVFFAGKSRFLK